MYVATRGLFKMKPPTIIVPKSIKATVEKLFEVHRELDGSELNHQLIGMDVGTLFLRFYDFMDRCCTFEIPIHLHWYMSFCNIFHLREGDLQIGEEFNMGKNLIVKAFKTYHVVPSQVVPTFNATNCCNTNSLTSSISWALDELLKPHGFVLV